MWTALETAFNAAKAADTTMSGLTLTRQVGAETFYSKDGLLRTADKYTITVANGELATGKGWVANGELASSNAFSATVDRTPVDTTPGLVIANIVLDGVGRGSMGGDLVVGGLSVGDTSTSTGVDRFEITVNNNSKLQNITSTNETLKEVKLVNGTTNGNITVIGEQLDLDGNGVQDSVNTLSNTALPGSEKDHDAYGFNDLRVLDASTMNGKVDVDAIITDDVAAYMNAKDTNVNGNKDDVSFKYTLGNADDKLTLHIDEANLDAAGTTTREDFVLAIAGGTGNDTITTNIVKVADSQAKDVVDAVEYNNELSNWYNNSKHNANLSVDAGAGDDTVNSTGAGDFKITMGTGNDTVYADNSGAKGAWVTNASNNDLTDLRGIELAGNKVLYKSTVTVTLSGATKESNTGVIDPAANAYNVGYESVKTIETTGYIGNQVQINQAIKDAVNSDAVLSKLIVATDGPDNTVVIKSLVDGAIDTTDIKITWLQQTSASCLC